jgi:hypothetical protein
MEDEPVRLPVLFSDISQRPMKMLAFICIDRDEGEYELLACRRFPAGDPGIA